MTDLIQTLTTAMQESKAWPAVYGAGTAEVLAQAALTAINEAGLVIVPREPSEAMADAMRDVPFISLGNGDYVEPDRADIYRAAITTGEAGQ